MAGESTSQVPEKEEPTSVEEEAGVDLDGDEEDESGDEESEKKEPEKEEEKVETILKKAFDELQQKYIEVATENSLLQTRIPKEDKEEPKGPKVRSDEEILTDLRSGDPNKTIKALREIARQEASQGDEGIRGESKYEKAVHMHEAALVRDFPDIRTNPEFQQVAAAIYNELEGEGRHPRNVYTAAATAYALLLKAGKIAPPSGEPSPEKKPKLRIAPKNPILTKNGDGEDENDEDDPLSSLSEKDIAKIKLNAKRLDVPVEAVFASLRKKMKEDSSYGRK